jgi:Dinucleotide-utilizing enzymes involved in molybdopterin and thiamine biosynthesis family 1
MHNALHNGLARYLSPDQLEALRAARVGIAGAGGLGSNAALMLARSGVGNLVLVDDDVVDASNLNRQQYWPRHVGRPKVEALAELLLELNPEMGVEARRMRLDQSNMAEVLPTCPIWVEAFDGPDDKTLLVETALLGGYRIASASGMGGWGGKAMGKRYLGNLVLVGDFSTDILLAPPLAPPCDRSRRPAG